MEAEVFDLVIILERFLKDFILNAPELLMCSSLVHNLPLPGDHGGAKVRKSCCGNFEM
jgi:hypothetical protein